MSNAMIPSRMLFRFAAPVRRLTKRKKHWNNRSGTPLEAEHRLPELSPLDGRAAFAEVRCGWSDEGLAFQLRVRGKGQSPWCRAEQPEVSDGLHVWIDTRDVHNVHRASRFCHRFVFLPGGEGKDHATPMATWLPIHRAKRDPRRVDPRELKVRDARSADGYELHAFIPAESLTGYDPAEHPRLGFQYAVLDRELGHQTFAAGRPLPYQEDPSLWATLELVE